jgi:hypothetical protein
MTEPRDHVYECHAGRPEGSAWCRLRCSCWCHEPTPEQRAAEILDIAEREQRRRFDDWRCYRCGTYHLATTAPSAYVENQAGYRMPVCCD